MNGGPALHITPNPMEEADRQSAANLQDMLPPPPPTMPPAFQAEHNYNGTLDGRNRGRLTPQPAFATIDRVGGRYTPQHSDTGE